MLISLIRSLISHYRLFFASFFDASYAFRRFRFRRRYFRRFISPPFRASMPAPIFRQFRFSSDVSFRRFVFSALQVDDSAFAAFAATLRRRFSLFRRFRYFAAANILIFSIPLFDFHIDIAYFRSFAITG